MIQAFKITNYLDESLYLDIRRPEDTGFLVSSVEGITDPKADISSSPYAISDGEIVENIHVAERNIVMTIIFYQDNYEKKSVEELRHRCYRYFPLKKELTFYVINDSGTYWIKGYVESNEIKVFTKTEGSQISIICPDPYFTKVVDNQDIYITRTVPTFQFPVSFEAIIPDDPLAPEIDYKEIYSEYTESLIITPQNYSQTIPTKYTYLDEDITINKVISTEEANGTGGKTIKISGYSKYNGPYQVTPINENQILPTKKTYLDNNITVNDIPFSVIPNDVDGLDIRIGSTDDPVPEYQQLTCEFGYIKDYPEGTIDYIGTGETGVTIIIEFSAFVNGIRINNATRKETLFLDTRKIFEITGRPVRKLDVLKINTTIGHKSVTLIRDGKEYNVMHAILRKSKWPYLQMGKNVFTATASEGYDYMKVRLEYETRVLGV